MINKCDWTLGENKANQSQLPAFGRTLEGSDDQIANSKFMAQLSKLVNPTRLMKKTGEKE